MKDLKKKFTTHEKFLYFLQHSHLYIIKSRYRQNSSPIQFIIITLHQYNSLTIQFIINLILHQYNLSSTQFIIEKISFTKGPRIPQICKPLNFYSHNETTTKNKTPLWDLIHIPIRKMLQTGLVYIIWKKTVQVYKRTYCSAV